MKIKNEFENLPYYKERKMDGKTDVSSVRLPKGIKEELKTLLEKQYGSFNDGLKHILIEYLNTSCLERKYFNIQMVWLLKKNHDLLTEDFVQIGYFDNYKTIKELELEGKINELVELISPKDNYLIMDELHGFEDFVEAYNKLQMSFMDFTRYNSMENNGYLEHIEKSFGVSNDWFYLSFVLNNFLDEKVNGTYMDKYKGKENVHRGIGYFVDENNELNFFEYNWELLESEFRGKHGVLLHGFNLIPKDAWMEHILNSSNEELKRFLDDNDFKIEPYDKKKAIKYIEHLESELHRTKEELNNSISKKKLDDIIEKNKKYDEDLELIRGILAKCNREGVDEVELNVHRVYRL